jgi:hypothetical protein
MAFTYLSSNLLLKTENNNYTKYLVTFILKLVINTMM